MNQMNNSNKNLIEADSEAIAPNRCYARLNDEAELIRLGFIRHPDWDWGVPPTLHYKLEKNGKIFRAYVEHNNPPVYCHLGVVIEEPRGIVDRWRDCVSPLSVERKLGNLA